MILARLYSNENFPLPVVLALRELGHDVLTVQDSGHANRRMDDAAVFVFAISLGRAVLTFNRKHFVRLHTDQSAHAGIIVCTFDADFQALAKRIHIAMREVTDLRSVLLRVNR